VAQHQGGADGIYGPAYELCENRPREPNSEEYLNSEKYEIRHRDLDPPEGLGGFIARVNAARRENEALRFDWRLRFHYVDNDQLICYSKTTADRSNAMLMVVNLDPRQRQSGWTGLDLAELGVDPAETFQAHDLLTGARYLWHGSRNYVELDPQICPAHLFRLRRRSHTERDFDYFA
jgi:starch synthase (maltosyl-transferring)